MSHALISYFSLSRYSSLPGRGRCSISSYAGPYTPQLLLRVLASTARTMNVERAPVWSCSVRMSGVLGQKLGRKKSEMGGCVSSCMYSPSSAPPTRQVKYVYDCE